MVEGSILIILLYSGLLFLAFFQKRGFRPMEEFLLKVVETGHLPDDLNNSYSRDLKRKNVSSIEQLNQMLLARIGELDRVNKEASLSNESKSIVLLSLLYIVSFMAGVAIWLGIDFPGLFILLVALFIAGVCIFLMLLTKASGFEAQIINSYLESMGIEKVKRA
jgi:hypothetical protein